MLTNVLIIGPDFYNYNQSVAKAFEKLGYYVKTISYRDNFNTFSDRLRYNFLPKHNIRIFKKNYIDEINNEIYKVYKEMNPQIVLVIKGNFIYEKTLNAMKNITKVLWLMDSIKTTEETKNTIELYDHVCVFEKSDSNILSESNIKSIFLPLSFDETIYYPIDHKRKEIDIIFVGTLYKNRKRLLEDLVEEFSEYNIHIYGKYLTLKDLSTFYKYYIRGYKRYFKNRNIQPDEANRLYNNSKIALNIHHAQSNYGCNPRVFEILGTKTFQLVNFNKFVNSIFNDNEIISYHSEMDLYKKIKFYLSHDYERDSIAAKGYEKVMDEHKFIDRVRIIINYIDKN